MVLPHTLSVGHDLFPFVQVSVGYKNIHTIWECDIHYKSSNIHLIFCMKMIHWLYKSV